MKTFSWQSRLLPLTMTVIAMLFTEKAVVLAKDAASASRLPITQRAESVNPTAKPELAAVRNSAGMPVGELPVASPSQPEAVQPAELKLLEDLRGRRAALDRREHALDERSELLQAAELKLQAKLDELAGLQHKLEQADDARRKRGSADWSGLVRTYEDMRARDAAAIFNVLDLSVLLEVLDRMDDRKAASVLAAMSPERARLATQMLAQKRIRQDDGSPALNPAAPPADQHT